jgi:hypothetical protein
MKQEGIQYIGAKELNAAERAALDKLSTEYHRKISRMLKNMTSLVVHVKLYETAGKGDKSAAKKRRKYAIHARALAPTRTFTSTKAHDWDMARTLHKTFRDLENMIGKALRPDEQRPKRVSKAKLRNLQI